MTIGKVVKPLPYRNEPFAGFCLLVIIIYLIFIKSSVLIGWWWQYIFIHPLIISMIWLIESPSLNKVLGNKMVLRGASAGMFIYLSHIAIMMAVPGHWWIKTIVCVLVGWILYELYSFFSNSITNAYAAHINNNSRI